MQFQVQNQPAVNCIGKAVVNDNTEDKEDIIQLLDEAHRSLQSSGYTASFILPNPLALQRITPGDIIEVRPDGIGSVLFSPLSNDNAILLTNKCNSNCVMCPDSEAVRKRGYMVPLEKVIKIISLIPKDTRNICLTGGEPTLLKYDLIKVIEACNTYLPATSILLLSNGRAFSCTDFVESFLTAAKKTLTIEIPLYGASKETHDAITSSPGSFSQSIMGIKKLLNSGLSVGIRVVITRMNYEKLTDIAKYITEELPGIYRVQFMGIEMLGNAALNRDRVYIGFEEIVPKMQAAALYLLEHGVESRFYNFPLCVIEPGYWSFYAKSISEHKVRYKEECGICTHKRLCGGFFESTLNVNKLTVHPFINR